MKAAEIWEGPLYGFQKHEQFLEYWGNKNTLDLLSAWLDSLIYKGEKCNQLVQFFCFQGLSAENRMKNNIFSHVWFHKKIYWSGILDESFPQGHATMNWWMMLSKVYHQNKVSFHCTNLVPCHCQHWFQKKNILPVPGSACKISKTNISATFQSHIFSQSCWGQFAGILLLS